MVKTENIFDYLLSENTISDSTVIEKTGVSVENVLSLVQSRLVSEQKAAKVMPFPKKRNRTIKLTALIAAVLAAAVITAGAMGSFHEVFGGFFIGESPDGIYSGDDVVIESETTSVEYLGIAGDKLTASAAMKLRKNDGSNYIDNIENTWISTSYSKDERRAMIGDVLGKITYTSPLWLKSSVATREEEMTPFTNRSDVMGTFVFSFEDESTISAFVFTTSDNGHIIGETMTAEISDLSAYTVEEILYDYSDHYDENVDETGDYSNNDFYAALGDFLNEYGREEKNGLRLMINPETKDIVLAKETPLDVEFKLSVKMNYKTSAKKIDAEKLTESLGDNISAELTASPFNITLKATRNQNEDSIIDYPDELTIRLSDGLETVAFLQNVTSTDNGITVIYQFYNDNHDGTRFYPVALDPETIVSVDKA